MRVGDFQSCTFGLEPNLEIFFEDDKKILPLSFLHQSETITTISVSKKPLKLHELQYGLNFCPPDSVLKIENEKTFKLYLVFAELKNIFIYADLNIV